MTTNDKQPRGCPDLNEYVRRGIRTIAFVGLTKNTGKTTTLIETAGPLRSGRAGLGFISAGLDGETHDHLTGFEKPQIEVASGDFVVTGVRAAKQSSATLRHETELDIQTPMGRLTVARVTNPGDIILAGIRHQTDLHQALSALESYYTGPILVDGACGRMVNASAAIADGIIICTAGNVEARFAEALDRTRHFISRLRVPAAPTQWESELFVDTKDCNVLCLGGKDAPRIELSHSSALVVLDEISDTWARKDIHAIALPGVLSDRTAQTLLDLPTKPDQTLLLQDGTAIQTSEKMWRKLRRDWRIRVHDSVELLGISLNPEIPGRTPVDQNELLTSFRSEFPDIRVFDPLREGSASSPNPAKEASQ